MRHRAEAVEYRMEQHVANLGGRHARRTRRPAPMRNETLGTTVGTADAIGCCLQFHGLSLSIRRMYPITELTPADRRLRLIR